MYNNQECLGIRHRRTNNQISSSSLCVGNNLLRRLGLHIDQRMDKTVNNLVTLLVASLFDFCKLRIGFLARIFLDLLVSARVLLSGTVR